VTVGESRHGGIVFRAADHLHFLPASVAVKVMPVPAIARVPGAPRPLVGVALVDGETVPVIEIGPARGALLVISFLGERVGLVGAEVLATGRFETTTASVHGEHVVHEGVVARLFDVAAVVAEVRAGRWAV
jgi:chemotaxis signal transduction protein